MSSIFLTPFPYITAYTLNDSALAQPFAFQVYDRSEDGVLACQAMADQLHDTKRVGTAIDIVTQGDQPHQLAVGVIAAQIQQLFELAVASVDITDDVGARHGELRDTARGAYQGVQPR
jgi:hypothetical protein